MEVECSSRKEYLLTSMPFVLQKIVSSAQSLLNFMSGLAIFLCPIAAILSTDYWLVKKRCVDVPSLYRRRARYRYDHGYNWRAAVAFLIAAAPNIPG